MKKILIATSSAFLILYLVIWIIIGKNIQKQLIEIYSINESDVSISYSNPFILKYFINNQKSNDEIVINPFFSKIYLKTSSDNKLIKNFIDNNIKIQNILVNFNFYYSKDIFSIIFEPKKLNISELGFFEIFNYTNNYSVSFINIEDSDIKSNLFLNLSFPNRKIYSSKDDFLKNMPRKLDFDIYFKNTNNFQLEEILKTFSGSDKIDLDNIYHLLDLNDGKLQLSLTLPNDQNISLDQIQKLLNWDLNSEEFKNTINGLKIFIKSNVSNNLYNSFLDLSFEKDYSDISFNFNSTSVNTKIFSQLFSKLVDQEVRDLLYEKILQSLESQDNITENQKNNFKRIITNLYSLSNNIDFLSFSKKFLNNPEAKLNLIGKINFLDKNYPKVSYDFDFVYPFLKFNLRNVEMKNTYALGRFDVDINSLNNFLIGYNILNLLKISTSDEDFSDIVENSLSRMYSNVDEIIKLFISASDNPKNKENLQFTFKIHTTGDQKNYISKNYTLDEFFFNFIKIINDNDSN